MTAPSGQAALDNARQVQTYAVGYCLKYVRAEAWRVGSLYASAIDAWYGAIKRHPGDRHPPLGAPMFYAGGKYGHIVVCTKDHADGIRSTDCQTAGDVSEVATNWPVDHWGQQYLGWTEDLNGVDLPLDEEDEMTPADWDKLRSIVRDEVSRNNGASTDSTWDERQTVTKPNGQDETKAMRTLMRETWQRVAKLAG